MPVFHKAHPCINQSENQVTTYLSKITVRHAPLQVVIIAVRDIHGLCTRKIIDTVQVRHESELQK